MLLKANQKQIHLAILIEVDWKHQINLLDFKSILKLEEFILKSVGNNIIVFELLE